MHLVGDLLNITSVLIGGILIAIDPSFDFVDPICSIVFSLIVLFQSSGNMKQIFRILMESAPDDVDVQKLGERLVLIPFKSSSRSREAKTLYEKVHSVSIQCLNCWQVGQHQSALAAQIMIHVLPEVQVQALREKQRLMEESNVIAEEDSMSLSSDYLNASVIMP
jgi:Co/Zn/Cd efflux system component